MNQLDSFQHIPQTLEPQPQQSLFEIEAAPRAAGKNGATRRRNPARKLPATGKNYILDTNVLLHDPTCIQRFAENHVWIPVDVLSELDKFKNEQSERGANARAVHRELSRIFSQPGISVTDGAPTSGGGTVRIDRWQRNLPEESPNTTRQHAA